VAHALILVIRILSEHLHLIFRVPQPFVPFANGAGFASWGAQNRPASLEERSGRNLESFAQFLNVRLVERAFLMQDFRNDPFRAKN